MNKPKFVPCDQVEFLCVCDTCGIGHWPIGTVVSVASGTTELPQSAESSDNRTWIYTIEKVTEPSIKVNREEAHLQSLTEVPF